MCGSGRLGTSCHSLAIIAQLRKKATGGFAENLAETHRERVVSSSRECRGAEPLPRRINTVPVAHGNSGRS
jgi:hypothetical protein